MLVKMNYVLALVVRGEGSKSPVFVFPHEVELLRAVHGEDNIIVTKDAPPVESAEFDTADEFSRLEVSYRDAVKTVFRNLAEFEAGFTQVAPKTLAEQAESLGVNVDKRWGEDRLQDEIDKAKG